MTTRAPRSPTDWIVIAKGIGIILVVIGHFHPATSPAYWSRMRDVIYSFHMPLFFMLSGFLYQQGKYPYGALVCNKVRRLLYPFLSIALAFGVIKFAIGHFVALDSPVDARSVLAVVADPLNSYEPSLWFLEALFLIFCIYPLARRPLNDVAVLLLFVMLNEVFGNRYLFVGRALANLPFFAFGVLLRERPRFAAPLFGGGVRHGLGVAVIFAVACGVQLSGNRFVAHDYIVQWLVGLIGSWFVIAISRAVAGLPDTLVRLSLYRCGYYSMTIYFFHTLFESAVRIGFSRGEGAALPFEAIAGAAVSAGVVCPILLEKWLIRRSRIGRRFVLGMD